MKSPLYIRYRNESSTWGELATSTAISNPSVPGKLQLIIDWDVTVP